MMIYMLNPGIQTLVPAHLRTNSQSIHKTLTISNIYQLKYPKNFLLPSREISENSWGSPVEQTNVPEESKNEKSQELHDDEIDSPQNTQKNNTQEKS